jgi:hypothetical protein
MTRNRHYRTNLNPTSSRATPLNLAFNKSFSVCAVTILSEANPGLNIPKAYGTALALI